MRKQKIRCPGKLKNFDLRLFTFVGQNSSLYSNRWHYLRGTSKTLTTKIEAALFYMLPSIQSLLLSSQGEGRVGQPDSSQSWEDYPEHKLAHVEPRGLSEGKRKPLGSHVCPAIQSPNLGWRYQCREILKNRDGFGPMEGCVEMCLCLLRCFHRGSLCAGRYTPDRDSCRWVQEGMQYCMSD